ncbi:MAG TPA: sulfotransferase domain-containing protein [Opitutaceae bacterium]|jgi:hypothetical protein
MKTVVWLASYPKSGNTWFRAFLANFLEQPERPININHLDPGSLASARGPLDHLLGYDSSTLTLEESDRMRRESYLHLAREGHRGPRFVKVHDAFTEVDGGPLFPPECTLAAIYIVRHPYDVSVSYANHSGRDELDGVVSGMCEPKFSMCKRKDRYNEQLRQVMLSWSGHVESWLAARSLMRVHLVRFEDMKSDPRRTFGDAIRFLELPNDEARIDRAIEFSSFDVLKRQEETEGFREKLHANRSFFRRGNSGEGRTALSDAQRALLATEHGAVMKRLGYST